MNHGKPAVVSYQYERDLDEVCSVRRWPHEYVFVWKRNRFDAFSPIVHTTSLENADEKGGSQKRFPTLVERFVNASLWKRSVSRRSVDRWTRKLLKTLPKNTSYIVASFSVFGRFMWTMGENASESLQSRMKTYFVWKRISVDRWKQKTKTLVSAKILWEKNGYLTKRPSVILARPNVVCYILRLRKPPSQLPFTAEMLVTTQTEAAASPRSDSTLSAPHSTQNSPKPARYVPARTNFELKVNFVLRYHFDYLFTYLFTKVSKIIYVIFIHLTNWRQFFMRLSCCWSWISS